MPWAPIPDTDTNDAEKFGRQRRIFDGYQLERRVGMGENGQHYPENLRMPLATGRSHALGRMHVCANLNSRMLVRCDETGEVKAGGGNGNITTPWVSSFGITLSL